MRTSRVAQVLCTIVLGLLWLTPPAAADVIRFEDLFLKPESFYNGDDQAGGFVSDGAFFNNSYNVEFMSWKGWSVSNKTDWLTPGFRNQYSAFALPDGGGDESANYAVAFNFTLGDAFVILPAGMRPTSVRITNTAYASWSMLLGDPFAKRFGGASGDDPDWFLLTIYGIDERGKLTGVVPLLLADYTFEDNKRDYIVYEWTTVDLTPLGDARYLLFDLTSSDVGEFGMNTPAYFALDNLVTQPRR